MKPKTLKEIIFFLPDAIGGVTYFIYNLVKYNTNADISVTVILYRQKEEKRKKLNLKFNADKQINFVYSNKDNQFYVFKRLKKYIKSESAIIVANDGLELRLVNALKLKNPVFYIVHGDNDYYYKLVEQYNNIIDLIIPVSKFVENNISKKYSELSTKQIKHLFAPVNNLKLEKNILNSNNFTILFVGNILKEKGVFELAKIIEIFSESDKLIDFIIIGSGTEYNNLKKLLEKYNRVTLTGQLEHHKVIENYMISDILILPSYSEGLPLVVVEAMKAGVVPLCNDIPSGIPEIVINNETGFRVKDNNIEKYVEIITDLYNNREKLEKLGENAKKLANKHFNPEIQTKKYFDIFINHKIYIRDKKFKKIPVGRILNKKILPNFFVKIIRTVVKHPKF